MTFMRKDRTLMRKQLKGLALILFGILLGITGVVLSGFLPGEYPMIPCVFGIAVGILGVAVTFSDKKD